jgi:hypothetical protein
MMLPERYPPARVRRLARGDLCPLRGRLGGMRLRGESALTPRGSCVPGRCVCQYRLPPPRDTAREPSTLSTRRSSGRSAPSLSSRFGPNDAAARCETPGMLAHGASSDCSNGVSNWEAARSARRPAIRSIKARAAEPARKYMWHRGLAPRASALVSVRHEPPRRLLRRSQPTSGCVWPVVPSGMLSK